MNVWLTIITVLVLAAAGEGMVIANGNDPGKCNQTNHGKQVMVQDRENKELIIFCTKEKGLYKWTTIGGKTPVGELFNPGYDCSKILDSNPEAKDGMYFIHLGTNHPKQVWCDMTTDFGGFMLIGKTNSSVTWSVPSSDKPVEPNGDPQWASYLGDTPILDFRIQISTGDDLGKTLAHWSFRLQDKRALKNLMIIDHGCAPATPGIGNIAYVKDLQAEKIVSTNFRCSVFGGYYDYTTGFGWHMMNSCLRRPCRRGFAFFDHDLINHQTDHSGSFSFSASGSSSGIYNDATAFVGCDKKKCCSCFGPVGGTRDYCGTDCKTRRGGRTERKVYVWFWVRSSIPKKIWNKCMDYKARTENGDLIWYKLVDGNPTPKKGRCGQNEAVLNDGIVVVPDGNSARKVPAVPGLLKYRKDTEELYVRVNEYWSVVAQEKMVNKLHKSGMTQLKIEFQKNITQLIKEKQQLQGEVAEMKQIIRNLNFTLYKSKLRPDVVFFDSAILFGELDCGTFIRAWMGRGLSPKLCWRATRDGWLGGTFHAYCDYKKPTVTIVKVGRYVFGGYTTASWGGGGWKQSSEAFMFSLRNKENLPPFKAPLKRRKQQYAIYSSSNYGPIFGGGHDLLIFNKAASNTGSFTNFGRTYQPPRNVRNPRTILAGSYRFTPSEVEVFHLV